MLKSDTWGATHYFEVLNYFEIVFRCGPRLFRHRNSVKSGILCATHYFEVKYTFEIVFQYCSCGQNYFEYRNNVFNIYQTISKFEIVLNFSSSALRALFEIVFVRNNVQFGSKMTSLLFRYRNSVRIKGGLIVLYPR